VEVQASGENVGAGEALERQLSSVCAAAYGLHFWRYAGAAHGFLGNIHDVHLRLHLFAHVVVLVFYVDSAAVRKFVVDFA